MERKNYPSDWDERRQRVLDQHLGRCVNCRRAEYALQVHHIVPIQYGGSHQRSNLVPLCRQCHEAAHGHTMAPRVRWYTNGELSSAEFGEHVTLWKQMRRRLGFPRFDPDDASVYIPLADVDQLVEHIHT